MTTMKILTRGDLLTLGDGGNFHGTACMDNSAARNPRFWTQMATFCSMVNNKLKEEDFDEPDTSFEEDFDEPVWRPVYPPAPRTAHHVHSGNHHPDTGTWRPRGYVGHEGSSSTASRVAHPERDDTATTLPELWRGLDNPRL